MIGLIDRCFICGSSGDICGLEKHHIFNGSNRKKSEAYGLTVMLCGDKCHRGGKYSVHKNEDIRKKLQSLAQKYAMHKYNMSIDDFRRVFGKNYIL